MGMMTRVGRRLGTGFGCLPVVGVVLLLIALAVPGVRAQGPAFSAQIQLALRNFLTIAHSWTATQTFSAIVVNGSCTGCGTGTVTSIATTSPIAGGTITTTGTLSCPTCVVGPASVTTAHLAVFNGTTGKLIADGGAVPTNSFPGSSSDTQVVFNSSGSVAGFGSWDGTTLLVPGAVNINTGKLLINSLGNIISARGATAIVPDTPTQIQLSVNAESDGYYSILYQNKTYSVDPGAYWANFMGDDGVLNFASPTGNIFKLFVDGTIQTQGYKSSDGTTGATTTGFKNGLYVSAPGPTFVGILRGVTGSIGGGALAAGACASGNATVTGATTAMSASASPAADPDPSLSTGVVWDAFVSGADTVTVRVCGLVIVTPNATTYQVAVVQ